MALRKVGLLSTPSAPGLVGVDEVVGRDAIAGEGAGAGAAAAAAAAGADAGVAASGFAA